MARRRTRARITARIMKPMLMWMRTGGKEVMPQTHPYSPRSSSKVIPNRHP